MKSKIKRVGGRLECSSSLEPQHIYSYAWGCSVYAIRCPLLFLVNMINAPLLEVVHFLNQMVEIVSESVLIRGPIATRVIKKGCVVCRATLGVMPSGLFRIVCMAVTISPIFRGLMPIVIQYISGGEEHGQLLCESHQVICVTFYVSLIITRFFFILNGYCTCTSTVGHISKYGTCSNARCFCTGWSGRRWQTLSSIHRWDTWQKCFCYPLVSKLVT